ncbi:SMP-30/gluconolactonase/LRE family protein [Streptomyces sp. NPDC008343]|uniref:SMP-30/gluconolactonase/LRE family protein n=1 Tax=Streptomyces sp. NPDC008343 TaxID=3364828 RepID=UPI0036E4140E
MKARESSNEWRPYTHTRHQLAEGARWFGGMLHFVDLLRGDLYRCHDAALSPERLLGLGMPLGAVAPAVQPEPAWVVAAGDGIALCGSDGRLDWLGRPERRADRAMRLNDGACDPSGRFWAGSMATNASAGAGSLYRADPDGSVHRMLEGLTVPNGPAFTADGRLMYLADSALGTITRHTVDPATGELLSSAPFAELDVHLGRPDGMTVDDDGNLWVALWGGGQVLCYGADGGLLNALPVPTANPSSVAFGGGHMFVTTARHRLERPDPLAGAVLVRSTTVSAPPAAPFGREPTPP